MATGGKVPLVVIGVGERLRGDDAAGLLVVDGLKAAGISRHVWAGNGDPASLMQAMDGVMRAVIVDAVVTGGAEPGRIHTWNVTNFALPRLSHACSSHAVPLVDALELARTLGTWPESVEVIGIEGGAFALGTPPDPRVVAAVKKVVARLQTEFACTSIL